MAAYVFFDAVSVHPERMTAYRDKALASVKAFGGKLVAATNNIDCREGDWHPTRIVMLEFPSMEKARACRFGSMQTGARWSCSKVYGSNSPISTQHYRSSTKVVRHALQDAAWVASPLITTKAMVAE